MHGDLVFQGYEFIPFASLGTEYAENCITCVSPAKAFNIASCCSSFTIISEDLKRKAFQTENSRLTVNKNNAFANVAMEAAYTHGEDWLQRVLRYIEGNVDLVRSRLRNIPGVELIEPEGTFLLWIDFRSLGLGPDALHEFLREKAGWAVSRGQSFGEQGNGFARLNIGCTHARLDAALDQLSNAIHK